MKNKRFILLTLVLSLLVSCLPASKAARAEEEEEKWDFKLATKSISNVSIAYTGTARVLSGSKAESAGVPEGYSGKVISAGKQTSVGVTFDFTAAKISVNAIESITFRYYIESTKYDDEEYPELRIRLPNTTTYWALRHYAGEETDRWAELTLYADGTNLYKDYRQTAVGDNALSVFADKNGNLAYFELYVRRHSGSANFYIDSVTLNYKDNDGIPPVITVPGDSITIPYGSILNIGISAYDEDDGKETEVTYTWKDESRLDENGNPTIGEHTLIVSSSDSLGNISTKEIAVTVTEADKIPPVINISARDVYVPSGTKPQLRYDATDESGAAVCDGVWSEGAINEYGRLTDGLHTYTVTATDMSGNESVLVINFHVGEKNPAYN